MKNSEIAEAFSDGEETNNEKSFFVENVGGVIIAFSYGQHFPICVKFSDGVLFNMDSYSNTTARHKNLILATLNGDLADEDKMDTAEIKRVVDSVKYDGVRSKAELIEIKI